MRKHITDFGSSVVDLMARAPHLPVPGETVRSTMFKASPGGKGFNQCVAAHKAGAAITMVTKLGTDSFADIPLTVMDELGMDKSRILRTSEYDTGNALIMVDEQTSENMIVITPGACAQITHDEVLSLEDLIRGSAYMITQLEINYDALDLGLELAKRHGVTTILNPAPAPTVPLPDGLLQKIDIITPNEVEAQALTGVAVDDEGSAQRAADVFFSWGIGTVAITLGSRGVYIATRDKSELLPVPKVSVVDTTGAGDAWNGGFVTALAEGRDVFAAARFANALASLAVMKVGTTLSMPTRPEIDAFIERYNMLDQ